MVPPTAEPIIAATAGWGIAVGEGLAEEMIVGDKSGVLSEVLGMLARRRSI